ncbi:purine-nucleoside phosphorylase [Notoacmeibacter ruber]|uniref:Purine nucleoside phosphorylase n=1 Tax=Notoacmeibacter ruber TaxID=2670375 RepID=A0A3L7JGC6_9HYPH|nr:purine-nucleoside phosphorylase [Notoacmeibacter ruber]RLQ89259.1 purine-nucleoside phosphorylase [Notoacmeibacter ruber]
MVKRTVDILIERLEGRTPSLAVVLGSGLGPLASEVEDAVRIPYADLPDFPVSTVPGHAGEVVAGELSGRSVLMLAGRSHYYERGNPAAMAGALESLSGLGIKTLLLTNAAGSVHESMGPASVMLIEDHIALGPNPLIGRGGGEGFIDMSQAYDPEIRQTIGASAAKLGETIHKGVYCWFSGPSFETPAEIRMARHLGADAVGMSTVPEVILARFHGLRVGALSMITNLGAGMQAEPLSHEQTQRVAKQGSARLSAIIRQTVADLG